MYGVLIDEEKTIRYLLEYALNGDLRRIRRYTNGDLCGNSVCMNGDSSKKRNTHYTPDHNNGSWYKKV